MLCYVWWCNAKSNPTFHVSIRDHRTVADVLFVHAQCTSVTPWIMSCSYLLLQVALVSRRVMAKQKRSD
jgi:hypothetical protein